MDLGMNRRDSERMNYDNNFYREQSLENQNKKLRARVEELESYITKLYEEGLMNLIMSLVNDFRKGLEMKNFDWNYKAHPNEVAMRELKKLIADLFKKKDIL